MALVGSVGVGLLHREVELATQYAVSFLRDTQYIILDLSDLLNNDAISFDSNRADGDLRCSGLTIPAEDLPESDSIYQVDDVPFRFPSKADGAMNNIVPQGQSIVLPSLCYRALWTLGLSDGLKMVEEMIYSGGGNAVLGQTFEVSSWSCAGRVTERETVAIKLSGYHTPTRHVSTARVGTYYGIWAQEIPVPADCEVWQIQLPDNPALHFFAMTLEREGRHRATQ